MKFVADENIPLLKGVLEPFAEVVYVAGKDIDADLVRDADALLIRTRTHCDQRLLANSSIKFIGTATIGTDHIDLDYCRQNNIRVCSAAGCNAAAVMQYIITALFALQAKTGKNLPDCTLGIVGVGNVGSLVHKAAQAVGLNTLLNDPPRAAREGAAGFVSLEEVVQKSDIISLHVPLTAITKKLADYHFFEQMKPGAAFFNTSRGEVIDEEALLQHVDRLSFVALDVWSNEPQLNLPLMAAVDIATPHIAGYSIQGKCNATTLLVQAIASFFQLHSLNNFVAKPDKAATTLAFSGRNEELPQLISKIYPIFEDDKLLREHPQDFEQLRNRYDLRNDFGGHTIYVEQTDKKTLNTLQQLGCKTLNAIK